MQDRYTGDIGDFGKYGFLRALARHDLRLGVVWYLNPDEETNSDGGLTDYLDAESRDALRRCDPDLFDHLKALVKEGDRRVAAVRRRGILPPGTVFYEEPLTFHDVTGRVAVLRPRRLARREAWCQAALGATAEAELVFLDPDNGLPGKSVRPSAKNGSKYAFPREISPYLERGQSVVLYNHQTRRGTLEDQVQRNLSLLAELGGTGKPWALTYHRRQVRSYFVIPSITRQDLLWERSQEFIDGCWGRHFKFRWPQ